jgi:hypothetical protein
VGRRRIVLVETAIGLFTLANDLLDWGQFHSLNPMLKPLLLSVFTFKHIVVNDWRPFEQTLRE